MAVRYNYLKIPLSFITIIVVNLILLSLVGSDANDALLANDFEANIHTPSLWTTITNTLLFSPGQSYFRANVTSELVLSSYLQSLHLAAYCFVSIYSLSIMLGILFFISPKPNVMVVLRSISALPSALLLATSLMVLNSHHIYIQNSTYLMWLPLSLITLKSIAKRIDIITSQLSQEYTKPYLQFLQQAGISDRKCLLKYALKSALLIVFTQMPIKFLQLLFSIQFFEALLGLDGLGSLFMNATLNQDIPIISSCFIIYAINANIAIFISDYINQRYKRFDHV